MAKRTISTRLAIEGEAQYKQAIAGINAELRNHKSALDLVNSQYKGNANSMEALQAKQKALADLQSAQTGKVNELNAAYKNAQTAVDAYKERKEELTQKIEANEEALEKLKNTEGDTTEEQRKLTEETAKLKKELDDNDARLDAAEKGTNNWQTSLNKAQIELNKTNDEIKKNDQHLEEAKKSTDKAATSIDKFGKETKTAGESVDALGSALAAAGIVAALKQMADAMTACVQASIEFESAMTGVEKTTDLTDRELADMAESLKGLSSVIPTAAADLAEIAENAGQLGIQKENIVGFTRTMADLGVATNLTGEEASQAIAKIANITGMAQTDFDRFGSSVVALGNNFATTERDIVTMSTRLAAAGTLAGISEAEILALATAMSSVGIEAEAGGTAMTQTFNEIEKAVVKGGENLDKFARIAGMSANDFSIKWKTAPMEAIQAFLAGLGNLESQGESATLALDDMGLSGIRQANMLKSLSLASENVGKAVSTSNKAWSENTALAKEAELRYGTTESRLKLLNNALDRVKITIGNQLNPALNKLIEAGTGALDWINDFLESNDAIVPVITAVSVGLGVMVVGITAMTLATTIGAKALAAFKLALDTATGGATLIITAIVGLVAALGTLVLSFDDGIERASELTEATRAAAKSMEEASAEFEEAGRAAEASAILAGAYITRLAELEKQGVKTTEQQQEYANLVEVLKEAVPELNVEIEDQTGLLKGGAEAWKDKVAAMKEALVEEAILKRNTEAAQAWADAEAELRENQKKRDAETAKGNSLDEQRAGIIDAINERTRELTDESEKLSKETGILVGANLEHDLVLMDLREQYLGVNDAMWASGEQVREYDKAIAESNEALTGMNAELAELIPGWEGVTAAQADNSEQIPEFTEAQQTVIDSLDLQNQTLESLAAQHEETWLAARGSIDQQMGKWEEMDNKTTISAEKVNAALQSQITYMSKYTTNMTNLTDRNIGELARLSGMSVSETKKGLDGLVASLSDGSTESAQILAGLATASDEDIAAIVLSMQGVEKGKDAWATEMTAIDKNFRETMDGINSKLDDLEKDMNKYDAAARAAEQTAEGYTKTLESKIGAMRRLGERLGQAVTEGYNSKKGADIQSPSRKAIKSAEDTVEGYLAGYEKRMADMEKAGVDIAKSFTGGYHIAAANIGMSPIPNNQNGGANDIVFAIKGLRNQIGKLKSYSYIINGVTYDDGSNVSSAVKSLVRSIRLERRS